MAATATQADPEESSTEIPSPTPVDRLKEALARLDNKQKILLAVAFAAILAMIIVGSLMLKPPDFRILFSNISERDGGAIIASLEQMNIPYKFGSGGNSILITSEKVDEVRLRLASQGLPKAGNVGFELMENQKFGISQFAEQVNYQRGLEGELSRTIQSIAAVQAARVHLAIPKPTVFVREELKPSASVMLTMHPGRFLEPIQIAGIQNLVAASVPNLAPTSITLIDQTGAMISQLKSRLLEAGLDPTQIKYVQEIEANIVRRIDDILISIVGKGNSRVQVAADMDFSQIEQTAETHRPNNTPQDGVIRSQQTSESFNGSPTPAIGVPGALTNQPPVPPTAPLTQPAVAGANPQANASGPPISGQINASGVQAPITSVGQPLTTRKDATINYEVDKTIRHTKSAIGTVKRLSAAVVVNDRKDSSSKTGIRSLTDQEIKQITDLVKDAMGFSSERGDTISVVNTLFSEEEKSAEPLPFWKNPELLPSGKEMFIYALMTLLIGYILIGIVRPLVKTMLPPPPPPPVEEVEEEETTEKWEEGQEGEMEPDGLGGFHKPSVVLTLEKLIEDAREMVNKNPKAVADIIKDWTGTNGS